MTRLWLFRSFGCRERIRFLVAITVQLHPPPLSICGQLSGMCSFSSVSLTPLSHNRHATQALVAGATHVPSGESADGWELQAHWGGASQQQHRARRVRGGGPVRPPSCLDQETVSQASSRLLRLTPRSRSGHPITIAHPLHVSPISALVGIVPVSTLLSGGMPCVQKHAMCPRFIVVQQEVPRPSRLNLAPHLSVPVRPLPSFSSPSPSAATGNHPGRLLEDSIPSLCGPILITHESVTFSACDKHALHFTIGTRPQFRDLVAAFRVKTLSLALRVNHRA